VLVFNLGLTAFVKHLVKLVKQGPQSALREQKRKIVKRDRDLTVSVFLFSFFFSLTTAKAFRCSLFFHTKYMPHRTYRGTEVYFIRSSPSTPLQGSFLWPCKPSELL
jgi:hypothetical protein